MTFNNIHLYTSLLYVRDILVTYLIQLRISKCNRKNVEYFLKVTILELFN